LPAGRDVASVSPAFQNAKEQAMASGDDQNTPSEKPGYRSARRIIETQRAAERVARQLRNTIPAWMKDPDIWAKAREDIEKEEEERTKAKAGQSPDLASPASAAPPPTPPSAESVEPTPAAAAPAQSTPVEPEPKPELANSELLPIETELSPSAEWCCDRARELKDAGKLGAVKKRIELARLLVKDLAKAVMDDETDILREFDSEKYVSQNLEAWGIWPIGRI
jgi:hypothetical protein